MASAAAPAMEYVFVNASGPNRRPSCPSEGKDRNKGQGDDQQANEQRGSHFHGGVGNHLPAGGVVNLLTRMLMIPLLGRLCAFSIITMAASTIAPTAIAIPPSDMILAFSPSEVHDDKGDTQAKWQRNNRHQGRTDMPEEQCANDSNNDKLFKKLVTEVINRPVD